MDNLDFLGRIYEQYKDKIPALIAGIWHNGESQVAVAGVRKFGDVTPAEEKDKFHIASCGKALTATLVAALVEKGKLQWTMTLGQLLGNKYPKCKKDDKEFPDGQEGVYRQTTVEELLAHHSGLPGDIRKKIYYSLDDYGDLTREREKILAMLKCSPVCEPGKRFHYSNTGYVILIAAIEYYFKRSLGDLNFNYEDALKEYVANHLELTSLGFGPPGEPECDPPDQPWPHSDAKDCSDDEEIQSECPTLEADNPAATSPAGGMHLSMQDWLKFAKFHLDGLKGRPTPILTDAEFKKLHTPFRWSSYTPGGWGVDRNLKPDPESVAKEGEKELVNGDLLLLAHTGNNIIADAKITLVPAEEMAFAIATNYGGDSGQKASKGVQTEFFRRIERCGESEPNECQE